MAKSRVFHKTKLSKYSTKNKTPLLLLPLLSHTTLIPLTQLSSYSYHSRQLHTPLTTLTTLSQYSQNSPELYHSHTNQTTLITYTSLSPLTLLTPFAHSHPSHHLHHSHHSLPRIKILHSFLAGCKETRSGEKEFALKV